MPVTVSESHRTFNYGFGLPDIGPHAWLWDPVSKLIWHGKDKEAYFPDEYGKHLLISLLLLFFDLNFYVLQDTHFILKWRFLKSFDTLKLFYAQYFSSI